MTKITSPNEISSAAQDYVKAILALELAGEPATTSALANRMGVSAPSATGMAKRLAELGLVERTPYHGVALTDAGRRAALEVLRHHRLLERYLVETLGLPLDEVHAEADRLEHVLSEQLEAHIDEALGFPTHDPHGDPIPDRDLHLTTTPRRSLMDLAPGERGTIASVPDDDAERLRYLAGLALVPGQDVELTALEPFDGPATVRTGTGDHAIARTLAALIHIS